ncbi:hypothetical protein GF312_08690 [Candidatus Poribacteria bacterium]|nr:hypothetical protein [Candidatus Poribacteria bacterium]
MKTKKGKNDDKQFNVERREFIQKSAREVGGYGYAIYDMAKTIRTEILQGVVNEIRNTVNKA